LTPPSPDEEFRITPDEQGMRLDHYLVRRLPDQSRSGLGKSIRSGHIRVNNGVVKPGYRLHGGDAVQVRLPEVRESRLAAEPVDFTVLHEDEFLLVISKPPGIVVHPAAGHAHGTLANGLLYRYGNLPGIELQRPGIVHRLDMDTSGIMVVARTAEIQRSLARMFKDREVRKRYLALLLRRPAELTGRITAPIGRHPVNRKKMAVRTVSGRYAATSWEIMEQYANGMCLADVAIETGRTHQIRVHMASLGAPVVGDRLYGGGLDRESPLVAERQMLHSSSIAFIHPGTEKKCSFTAPLWPDMARLIEELRREYPVDR
jgi:23S rRNA pseudouridine1911/1915/1917 synthase